MVFTREAETNLPTAMSVEGEVARKIEGNLAMESFRHLSRTERHAIRVGLIQAPSHAIVVRLDAAHR